MTEVVVVEDRIEIVTEAEQGPRGIQGPEGPAAAAIRYDQAQSLSSGQKAQARTNVGLGNVDDTSDADKPVSTAQAAAIAAGDPVARGLGARAVEDAVLDRVLDKLFRGAQRAAVSNPRKDGVMSSPPTVTADGTTLPAGQTNAYTLAAKPTTFRAVGGSMYPSGSHAGKVRSAVIAATGGNLSVNDGSQGSCWRLPLLVDAAKVSFRVKPTTAAFRFLVDGQYVSTAGTNTIATSGSDEYISLDFGSRALRRVTLEGQQNCAFVGVYVGSTEKVYAAPAADGPTAVLLGDSYAYGSTAAALGDSFGRVMADWLGIEAMTCSGSGGTGWATGSSAYRFDQRITNGDLSLGGAPDVICLMASYNDRANSTATITANTLAGLQAARAAHPNALILVFGCFPGATGPSTGITDAENAVFAAVDSFGDAKTAKIPVSTITAGALITGTGKVGTTTGSGNSDIYTDTDGVHPPTAGHAFIGKWAAQQVLAAAASLR